MKEGRYEPLTKDEIVTITKEMNKTKRYFSHLNMHQKLVFAQIAHTYMMRAIKHISYLEEENRGYIKQLTQEGLQR